MKNAKPIFTIGLPARIEPAELEKIRTEYERKMKDYHVLVYYTDWFTEPKFNVFYDKDVEIADIENIKRWIQEQVGQHPSKA